MKATKTKLSIWLNKLGHRWKGLALEKQQKYILLLFAVYLLIYVTVLSKVWYSVLHPGERMNIEHMENPILLLRNPEINSTDSISKIFKGKVYERK